MNEQPSNQPTAPGDPASGVQGGGEALSSKQPASNEPNRYPSVPSLERKVAKLERERESLAALANSLLTDILRLADAIGSSASEPPALLADAQALKARVAELERERDIAYEAVAETRQFLARVARAYRQWMSAICPLGSSPNNPTEYNGIVRHMHDMMRQLVEFSDACPPYARVALGKEADRG